MPDRWRSDHLRLSVRLLVECIQGEIAQAVEPFHFYRNSSGLEYDVTGPHSPPVETIIVHDGRGRNLRAQLASAQEKPIAFEPDSLSGGYRPCAAAQLEQFDTRVILQHHHTHAWPAGSADNSFQPHIAVQAIFRTQGANQLGEIGDGG